jgi:hypothetical protein
MTRGRKLKGKGTTLVRPGHQSADDSGLCLSHELLTFELYPCKGVLFSEFSTERAVYAPILYERVQYQTRFFATFTPAQA